MGDGASAEELFPLAYEELRRLARRLMRRERAGHTLQPTALVHEAYLKLADQRRALWKGRTHFIAVGAQIMRQLLVDHARRRGAIKRGAGWRQVTLTEGLGASGRQTLDMEQLLSLDSAIDNLASHDERAARVVTLRLFGGLSPDEIAETLGVSRRTVTNDWCHSLAWLRKQVAKERRP